MNNDAIKHGYWICALCGVTLASQLKEPSTWHIGTCDYCQQAKAVTDARDFGRPELPRRND